MMVVILQITEGKIKNYRTAYAVYSGDDLKKFCTHCKREWEDKPSPQEECDHLDCAIYAAEYASNYQKRQFWIFLSICIFWFLITISIGFYKGTYYWSSWFAMSGIFALFAIYHIWQFKRFAKDSKELLDFRNHGTINGAKASQIFEDKEEAKAKHWWRFWL